MWTDTGGNDKSNVTIIDHADKVVTIAYYSVKPKMFYLLGRKDKCQAFIRLGISQCIFLYAYKCILEL